MIQNAPEKIHNHQHNSPVLQQCSSSSRHLPRNNSSTACGVGAIGGINIGSGVGCNSGGHNSTSLLNNRLLDNSNYDNLIMGQSMIQGQIIANIENNSINYERDWTLDDISQVSQVSFRPCPQGSGSLTPLPFHDSITNIYDGSIQQQQQPQQQSQVQSQQLQHQQQQQPQQQQFITNPKMMPNTSNKTNDLNLFKYHQNDNEQQTFSHPLSLTTTLTATHLPNSSVFLENRDILNDKDYPKLYNNHKICYRHSSILLSPDSEMNNDNNYMFYNNTNLTKQLQQHQQQQQQLQYPQANNNKLTNKDLHYVNRRYSDTKLLLQQQLENQLLLMKNQNIDLTKILGSPINRRHTPSMPINTTSITRQITQQPPQPFEQILNRTNTTVHPLSAAVSPPPQSVMSDSSDPPPAPPSTAISGGRMSTNLNNLFFEQIANDTFDPNDLNENIQQMIELDIQNQQKLLLYKQQHLDYDFDNRNSKKLMKLSLDNVLNTTEHQLVNMGDASNKKNIFKSLPNLSSSSENLLP